VIQRGYHNGRRFLAPAQRQLFTSDERSWNLTRAAILRACEFRPYL